MSTATEGESTALPTVREKAERILAVLQDSDAPVLAIIREKAERIVELLADRDVHEDGPEAALLSAERLADEIVEITGGYTAQPPTDRM